MGILDQRLVEGQGQIMERKGGALASEGQDIAQGSSGFNMASSRSRGNADWIAIRNCL